MVSAVGAGYRNKEEGTCSLMSASLIFAYHWLLYRFVDHVVQGVVASAGWWHCPSSLKEGVVWAVFVIDFLCYEDFV